MNRHGFTLVELIVVMALVSILVTMGIPSFREMLRQNQLDANTNALIAGLHLARSEAIKRGVRVTLCKSANGATCVTTGGYQQGWLIFVNPNNNALVDPGEETLWVTGPLPDNVTLAGNTTVGNFISYTASGATQLLNGGFQAGTLTLCVAPKAHLIVINNTGRVRVVDATC
jgi:type IV fimbrial biogenesis protein FimT